MKRKAGLEATGTAVPEKQQRLAASGAVDLASQPPLTAGGSADSRPRSKPAQPTAAAGPDKRATDQRDPPHDEDGAAQPKARKAPPVLPWMRLPISIEAGTGIPLDNVCGLHAQLLSALRRGVPVAPHWPAYRKLVSSL